MIAPRIWKQPVGNGILQPKVSLDIERERTVIRSSPLKSVDHIVFNQYHLNVRTLPFKLLKVSWDISRCKMFSQFKKTDFERWPFDMSFNSYFSSDSLIRNGMKTNRLSLELSLHHIFRSKISLLL